MKRHELLYSYLIHGQAEKIVLCEHNLLENRLQWTAKPRIDGDPKASFAAGLITHVPRQRAAQRNLADAVLYIDTGLPVHPVGHIDTLSIQQRDSYFDRLMHARSIDFKKNHRTLPSSVRPAAIRTYPFFASADTHATP